MTDEGFRAMKGVSGLNSERRIWQSSCFSFGGCHEHRQDAVRSSHGLSALEDLPSIVDRCKGDRYLKSVTCADEFRVMAFAQLTCRESLRDIEVYLSAQVLKLYHMGLQ